MTEKHYTKCEKILPIENFIKRRISCDGYADYCNDCREEKEREYEKLRAFATKGMDSTKFYQLDGEEQAV